MTKKKDRRKEMKEVNTKQRRMKVTDVHEDEDNHKKIGEENHYYSKEKVAKFESREIKAQETRG